MPDRSEVDGVEVSQLLDRSRRKCLARLQVPLTPKVKLLRLVSKRLELRDRVKHFHRFRRYFGPGPITTNYRNLHRLSQQANRQVWHSVSHIPCLEPNLPGIICLLSVRKS